MRLFDLIAAKPASLGVSAPMQVYPAPAVGQRL